MVVEFAHATVALVAVAGAVGAEDLALVAETFGWGDETCFDLFVGVDNFILGQRHTTLLITLILFLFILYQKTWLIPSSQEIINCHPLNRQKVDNIPHIEFNHRIPQPIRIHHNRRKKQPVHAEVEAICCLLTIDYSVG